MDISNNNIQIVNFNIEQCKADKGITRAIPGNTTIHFILQGYGKFKCWHLSPGDAFICKKDIYSEWCPDEKNPWTYAYITLVGSELDNLLNHIPQNDYVFKWNPAENQNMLLKIFNITDTNCSYAERLCQLGNFYMLMSKIIDSKPTKTKLDYVNSGILYMKNNYESGVTIADTASYLHLSRAYFRNIFHEITGISPMAYLMKIRMNRASFLLKQGYSVSEVSNAVGYDDILQFSRMFHRYYHISPTEYKKGKTPILPNSADEKA